MARPAKSEYEILEATLTVFDGKIYCVAKVVESDPNSSTPVFLALDAKTGRELWRCATGKSTPMQILVTEEGVYGTGDYRLWGVDRKTGRELWPMRQLYRTANEKDYLYVLNALVDAGPVIVGNTEQGLVAYDKTNAKTAWELPGRFRGKTAVVGNILYATEDGDLKAIELKTREVVWSYRRAGRNADWGFHGFTPIDGGLWANHFGAIVKLQ